MSSQPKPYDSNAYLSGYYKSPLPRMGVRNVGLLDRFRQVRINGQTEVLQNPELEEQSRLATRQEVERIPVTGSGADLAAQGRWRDIPNSVGEYGQ